MNAGTVPAFTRKHDVKTGAAEAVLEHDFGAAAIGATDRYVYYVRLGGAGGGWSLCRLDYMDGGALPEVLRRY